MNLPVNQPNLDPALTPVCSYDTTPDEFVDLPAFDPKPLDVGLLEDVQCQGNNQTSQPCVFNPTEPEVQRNSRDDMHDLWLANVHPTHAGDFLGPNEVVQGKGQNITALCGASQLVHTCDSLTLTPIFSTTEDLEQLPPLTAVSLLGSHVRHPNINRLDQVMSFHFEPSEDGNSVEMKEHSLVRDAASYKCWYPVAWSSPAEFVIRHKYLAYEPPIECVDPGLILDPISARGPEEGDFVMFAALDAGTSIKTDVVKQNPVNQNL